MRKMEERILKQARDSILIIEKIKTKIRSSHVSGTGKSE